MKENEVWLGSKQDRNEGMAPKEKQEAQIDAIENLAFFEFNKPDDVAERIFGRKATLSDNYLGRMESGLKGEHVLRFLWSLDAPSFDKVAGWIVLNYDASEGMRKSPITPEDLDEGEMEIFRVQVSAIRKLLAYYKSIKSGRKDMYGGGFFSAKMAASLVLAMVPDEPTDVIRALDPRTRHDFIVWILIHYDD